MSFTTLTCTVDNPFDDPDMGGYTHVNASEAPTAHGNDVTAIIDTFVHGTICLYPINTDTIEDNAPYPYPANINVPPLVDNDVSHTVNAVLFVLLIERYADI